MLAADRDVHDVRFETTQKRDVDNKELAIEQQSRQESRSIHYQ